MTLHWYGETGLSQLDFISASELDETLIYIYNPSIQILGAVTSILKIEDLNIEAKQRNLSLKTLVFSVLVFQKHPNLSPDVLFLCRAENIPL